MERGRSTQAAVRAIIAHAVEPAPGVRMGDALFVIGRRHGITNADVDALRASRDATAADALEIE